MASALTQDIASLRAGVRRVVLVLAEVPAVTIRKGAVSKIEKAAALAAVEGMTKKARGTFDMKRDFEDARALAFRIREAREDKRNERKAREVAARVGQGSVAGGRRFLAVRMQRPLNVRIRELRVARVEAAAKSTLRYGASGGTEFNVRFVEPGQPVDYTIETHKNWNTYSKRCRYPALEDHHHIVVCRDWLSTVTKIGRSIVDRCMILAAKPEVVSEDGERTIWKATVARQGAGYSTVVEERWISGWGHGVLTLHRSFGAALREHPPQAVIDRVRKEASDRELDRLSAEDLEALNDIAA